MKSQLGFGLMELLFGMALGSVVCLGALTLLESSGSALKSMDESADSLESRAIALEAVRQSAAKVRANLCGADAIWRNHLQPPDMAWWHQVQRGIRVYGGNEISPGTPFGAVASRRINGTEALDLHFFAPSATDVTGQEDPDSEVQVSSIQEFQFGDVAVSCSPVSTDIFMVTGRNLGMLAHEAKLANAFGLANCSDAFHAGDQCTGARRCIAGRGDLNPPACPSSAAIPATRLGKVKTLRWYIGRNAQGGSSLYSAEIENRGQSMSPTEVRPSEVLADVSDLTVKVYRSGSWIEPTDEQAWTANTPVRVSLTLKSGKRVTAALRFMEREAL